MPPFMTINEFHAWSRLGRTKTYEFLACGELRAIKVGRRTLCSSDAARARFAAQPACRSILHKNKAA